MGGPLHEPDLSDTSAGEFQMRTNVTLHMRFIHPSVNCINI